MSMAEGQIFLLGIGFICLAIPAYMTGFRLMKRFLDKRYPR